MRQGRILFAICLLIAWGTIGTTIYSAETDWDNAPASELHKWMAEGKARALLNKADYRRLASSAALASTQTNYDVKFYDVYIRVNDTNKVLYGRVGFIAAAAQNGVSEIQIDYYRDMIVDSIVGPSGPLAYSRLVDIVTLTLDDTYNAGEEFSFDFYYHGHPTEGGFQAFSFDTWNGGVTPSISSLSEPYFARTWWPCKDRPDDKADSFNIAIEVDTSFYVGSNGTLDSTVGSGGNSHTYFYSVRYPMTTYLFSVAIARYTVWHDEWPYNSNLDTMLITHAVFPDRYAYSLSTWGITPDVLTVLSDNFGQYPFVEEKYGHSNFTWGGGMEHQTMTSMSGSGGFGASIVVHEAAHQWFGDAITCDSWGHIWLNEGWASYAEALWAYAQGGWSSYHNYMGSMDYTAGGSIYIHDTTSVWNIFSWIVYDKGAWVCHMLRGVLGDSAFFAGIDAYMNSEYYHNSATTEQFRDIFEGVSGQDLDWFFEDWIYGTYRPYYRYAWYQEDHGDGTYDIYLRIRQTQTTSPQVFRMPVDVYLQPTIGMGDTITLKVDDRVDVFQINAPYSIQNVRIDPASWVLKYYGSDSWTLFFITPHDGLDTAVQYSAYSDTVEARGGTGSFTYSVIGGQVPPGWTLSNSGVISGITSDTGWFSFTLRVDDNVSIVYDTFEYRVYVAPGAGVPGDMNLDGEADPVDLSYLVDYMFGGGSPPLSAELADVNGDCAFDAVDLSYFVDFLFSGGPAPQLCPE